MTSGFLNELVRDDILRQKNLGIELTPLQAELWRKREEIQPQLPQSDPPLDYEFPSLKAAIDVLRTIVGTITDDTVDIETIKGAINLRRTEIAIAQAEIKRLQQCLAEQNKANAALEKYSQRLSLLIDLEKSSYFVQCTMLELSIIANSNSFLTLLKITTARILKVICKSSVKPKDSLSLKLHETLRDVDIFKNSRPGRVSLIQIDCALSAKALSTSAR